MTVWVALLRGVNVGSAGRLPMAAFRAMLERLGARDVRSYIQSGNAVFRSAHTAPALEAEIAAGIAVEFGFRPSVLLRGVGEMADILAANPFAKAGADPKCVHIFFLTQPAAGADVAGLRALAARGEVFHLTDAAFYLYAPEGIGRSALAARAERLLAVPATARNLRTAEAVAQMAQDLAVTEE
ncbi:DUF1697 domain-containing protein [Phaeovulum sp.]|uniref:DUF1697 domain-containing protein n=1 Tax=Phaeovulum sp. TaxID=2934796 RepID=UPI0035626F67